jgi:hypothetical protein
VTALVPGFYDSWRTELAKRDYGAVKGFDHQLQERDQRIPETYVLDDCVAIMLSEKTERRAETRLGYQVSESWRDIINFFERAEEESVQLLNPDDINNRAKGGYSCRCSDEFSSTFTHLKQVSRPFPIQTFEADSYDLGPRDSRIAAAADEESAVVVTYDADFFEADVPANTPLGAYVSMLE